MRYEIWEVCFFDEVKVQSLILLKTFDDFTEAYTEFQKIIKITPCCIILNKGEKE